MPVVKEKGVLHVNGMSSGQLLDLIRSQHCKDLVVDECKNGQTWSTPRLLKLDAWVLKKTYSPLTTIGYEIKVSRSDFEQDQKWVDYMDYCHQFYFVCPAGLIRSIDLPKEVGLYWTTMKGDKLHLKKHAERRQPNIHKMNSLLFYVLMSRTRIVSDMYEANRAETETDRVTKMQEYLKKCEENGMLAEMIRGYFRKTFTDVMAKDRILQSREDKIKRFEQHLAKLGITWDSEKDTWWDSQNVDNQIDALKKAIDYNTLSQMERVGKLLTDTVSNLRSMTGA